MITFKQLEAKYRGIKQFSKQLELFRNEEITADTFDKVLNDFCIAHVINAIDPIERAGFLDKIEELLDQYMTVLAGKAYKSIDVEETTPCT